VSRGAHLAHLVGRRPEQRLHTTRDGVWRPAAQYLPLVLWMEADRMASARQGHVRIGARGVKEERRMRIDNQPYGGCRKSSRQAFDDAS